jgi:hypothetical protein
MRTLMEWMGHRDLSTTLVYADFAPSTREADLLDWPSPTMQRPSRPPTRRRIDA